MSKLLVESTAVPQATGVAGRWKATLITPGQGSSGHYSESVLRETGPAALRKGAKSFVTHNRLENGEPDPFRMWGFLAEDAYYEEGVGLVGEIEVLPSWRDRVAEVAPHTALSVYVMGESDVDGNITSLSEAVDNGVDMVVYPGRPGSELTEKLYENAQKISGVEPSKNSDTSDSSADATRKVQEKAMEEAIKALTSIVESLVTKMDAAEKRAVEAAEAIKAEAAKTPEFDAFAAADKVAEAKLTPALHSRVVEGIKSGNHDVDALIADAKEIQESVKASLGESVDEVVRVSESGKKESISGILGIKVAA